MMYEQDMLQQEMVRQQADLEEDRDDDPELDETDAAEESKGADEKQFTSTQREESDQWKQMITSHGQDNWNAIYEITNQNVSRAGVLLTKFFAFE